MVRKEVGLGDSRENIIKRDDNKCQNCAKEDNLEVHHIVPISQGGDRVESNCITLCQECHKAAHGDTKLNNGVRKSNTTRIVPEKDNHVICEACHKEVSKKKGKCPNCHHKELSEVLEY